VSIAEDRVSLIESAPWINLDRDVRLPPRFEGFEPDNDFRGHDKRAGQETKVERGEEDLLVFSQRSAHASVACGAVSTIAG
jgi:hypothetical protein